MTISNTPIASTDFTRFFQKSAEVS
jgi:hypothetical protein